MQNINNQLGNVLGDTRRNYSIKDNYTNFFYLFVDYALIVAAIYLFLNFKNIYIYLITCMIIGSRMRALENLCHEASHGSLFKNRWINDFFGSVFCAFPVFNSLPVYRKAHMNHHAFLGTGKDPDYVRFSELGLLKLPGKLAFLGAMAMMLSFIKLPSYLIGQVKSFWFGQLDKDFWMRVILSMGVGVVLTQYHFWYYFLILWVIPFLTFFQYIKFFAEVSEHGGLYNKEKKAVKLSRNNLCHPVLQFFLYPHSDNLHLVHHMLPSIPHFNAYKAHEKLMSSEEYINGHSCYGFVFGRDFSKTTIGELIGS